MEIPQHLLLDASSRLAARSEEGDRTPSMWSKAAPSYCGTPLTYDNIGTPSLMWSKTPSPPGTPLMGHHGHRRAPDFQGLPPGIISDGLLAAAASAAPHAARADVAIAGPQVI